jgi:hypothetical protein
MTGKPWYQSRTIWAAILQGIIGFLVAFNAENPEMNLVGWVAMLKSLYDFIIRLRTNEAVQA